MQLTHITSDVFKTLYVGLWEDPAFAPVVQINMLLSSLCLFRGFFKILVLLRVWICKLFNSMQVKVQRPLTRIWHSASLMSLQKHSPVPTSHQCWPHRLILRFLGCSSAAAELRGVCLPLRLLASFTLFAHSQEGDTARVATDLGYKLKIKRPALEFVCSKYTA